MLGTAKLESVGFVMGKSCLTVFHRASTGRRCVVHGDDFTLLMLEGDIKELVKNLRRGTRLRLWGELGGEQGDQHESTILNRQLRWSGATIEYEADEQHAQEINREMGLENESMGVRGTDRAGVV